jgi:hypothetical protein
LLIPGPASPGKDFDIFLEPLVMMVLVAKYLIFVLQFCGTSMITQL